MELLPYFLYAEHEKSDRCGLNIRLSDFCLPYFFIVFLSQLNESNVNTTLIVNIAIEIMILQASPVCTGCSAGFSAWQ